MGARDLLAEGRLVECAAAQRHVVQQDPADPASRFFLFQVLALLGQWDRARTQLRVLPETDPHRREVYTTYEALSAGGIARQQVFAGEARPSGVSGTGTWLDTRASAIAGLAADPDAPRPLESLNREQPWACGQVDGQSFCRFADRDLRLSPVLELFIDGVYQWALFTQVRSLRANPPGHLQDLVWQPVMLFSEGTAASPRPAFVPARYPGIESVEDAALRTGRRNDFVQTSCGEIGTGQRIFTADDREVAVLDVRNWSLCRPDTKEGSA